MLVSLNSFNDNVAMLGVRLQPCVFEVKRPAAGGSVASEHFLTSFLDCDKAKADNFAVSAITVVPRPVFGGLDSFNVGKRTLRVRAEDRDGPRANSIRTADPVP